MRSADFVSISLVEAYCCLSSALSGFCADRPVAPRVVAMKRVAVFFISVIFSYPRFSQPAVRSPAVFALYLFTKRAYRPQGRWTPLWPVSPHSDLTHQLDAPRFPQPGSTA